MFVEAKHPDNKRATVEKRKKSLEELQKELYPYKIGEKYKSMLLRKWASGDVYPKPIVCIFVLEFSKLTKAERAKLKVDIFNRIPFSLNKPEFGGRKHLEKRFELLSFSEFQAMFPMFTVRGNDI